MQPGSPVRLAEMTITADQIATPVGVLARRGATWMTGPPMAVRATPTWATVTAIVLSPCTLGVSFLLMLIKTTDLDGRQTFPLTVSDGRIEYTTIMQCANRAEFLMFSRMINDLRVSGPLPLPPVGQP